MEETSLPQIDILYQDQDLVVVNKPAGIVVNRAQTVDKPTIQDWFADWLRSHQTQTWLGSEPSNDIDILHNKTPQAKLSDKPESIQDWQELIPQQFDPQYGQPTEIFVRRQGLVHRLDKDTSGVLLLARNPGSLVNLLHQFKQRLVNKTYLALVHGQFKVKSATIRAPIKRSVHNRHQFAVAIDGRSAQTVYQMQRFYSGLNLELLQTDLKPDKYQRLEQNISSYHRGFSLVEFQPKSGRTHQIRVHAKHLHHPLVADQVYGGGRGELDQIWCPRQFLHSGWLEFIHPRSQQKVSVQAPLALDLSCSLGYLAP